MSQSGLCTWFPRVELGFLPSPCLAAPSLRPPFHLRGPRHSLAGAVAVVATVLSGCFALFWLAWRVRAPCLLLLGATSCVASSPRLGYLRSLPGVVCRPRACCSSRGCSSGSMLLCATGLEPSVLDFLQLPPAVCSFGRPCPPGHCPVFVRALAGLVQVTLASLPDPAKQKVGFESLLVNDLLSAGQWHVGAAWSWPTPPEHINVLETRAFLAVLRQLGREGGDKRLVQIVDSSVALGATTKGRSSARTLRRPLLQACALQLGCGLYPATVFGPTRLNVADAPTRDRPLPEPTPFSLCDRLPEPELLLASTFRQLPRASANWLRLSCLLVGFRTSTPLSGFLRSLVSSWRHSRPACPTALPKRRPDSGHQQKNFDSTLGFPGEALAPKPERHRTPDTTGSFCPALGKASAAKDPFEQSSAPWSFRCMVGRSRVEPELSHRGEPSGPSCHRTGSHELREGPL